MDSVTTQSVCLSVEHWPQANWATMLLLAMATSSIHVAHPHILISTYHLSADQKLQTLLLELPVCICVVARNLRHSVSIINLRFLGEMRKKLAACSMRLSQGSCMVVRCIWLNSLCCLARTSSADRLNPLPYTAHLRLLPCPIHAIDLWYSIESLNSTDYLLVVQRQMQSYCV